MNLPCVVAIEIGTAKVAAIIAEIRKDGVIAVLGHGNEPSSGVRKAKSSISTTPWFVYGPPCAGLKNGLA